MSQKTFPVMLFAASVLTLGQVQQQPVPDLNLLVGKQVIVQRVPLCQPGTYAAVLTYAGKTVKVISIKTQAVSPMAKNAVDRMPPQARATIEDALKAATILVEAEDGTRLDTCAAVLPSLLPNYFELAPGEILAPPAQRPTESSTDATARNSPVSQSSARTRPSDLLSPDEVNQALSGNGRNHWVLVEDMGLMAAQGNQVPSVTLYMPEAVLAIQAESAKKQFIHYEPSEDDIRRSLLVVAQGYAGKTITEGCTSITRVVLVSDPSGRVVKEAYLSEPLEEKWRNNFGATNRCQALRAEFSMNDVHEVRAAAPNGEFLVAVFSGAVNTKMYKVKKKHQAKLSLP
jgi:hypothetical protein